MLQILQYKNSWFWTIAILFLGVNAYLITIENYVGLLLPIAVVVVLMAIYRFDLLLLTTVFLTPLSHRFNNIGNGIGLDLPSDILIAILGLVIFCKFIYDRHYYKDVLNHPITLGIFLNLLWICFTCFTSSMPIISLKYFISRFLYVIVFYFALAHVFKNPKYWKQYFWLYIIPFIYVVIYTLLNHTEYNFDQRASYGMSQPYYINHGIYSIPLAFFLPFIVSIIFKGEKLNYSIIFRVIICVLLLLFIVGLIYSYTRAAWISLIAAIGLYIILSFKIKPIFYFLFGVIAFLGVYNMRDRIQLMLHKNKQVSADNFEQHIKSIYNISNDDSNLERINRWKSAWRMVLDRPLVGFGPGTYVFQYAPYQRSKEMTKISTNVGTLGNAHSEYFQPMAETGFIGLISFVYMLFLLARTSIKLHYRVKDKQIKILNMCAILGLTTYFVHGLLNNYSDQDKAAVLIWGFMAMIVAMDISQKQSETVQNL